MSLPASKPASSKDRTDPKLAPADPGYVRLHISPLDADLLNIVIPSAVLTNARNVSLHTLDTFPDRPYGFVDLPTEAAEKLKKKLNGATLRGNKMRVDKARPPKPEYVPEPDVGTSPKKRKKIVIDFDGTEVVSSKKRKKDRDVKQGIVLEDDRKVKRGWTVTPEQARKSVKTKVRSKKEDKDSKKDKKDKEVREVRSKYTDKQECLIKTVVPHGKPMPEIKIGAKSKKRGKDGKSNREIVAHEYEHAVKFPTFLRDAPKPAPAPVSKKTAESESSSSESESSSSDEDEEEKLVVKKNTAETKPITKPPVEEADDTTSSEESSSEEDSSSPEDSSEEEEGDSEEEKSDVEMTDGPAPTPFAPIAESDPSKLDERPTTSGSMKSLTIKIPPPPATPSKVHPLEALYKKKPEADTEAATNDEEPFSFFGAGASGSDIESEAETPKTSRLAQPPMTPFTRQDFEARGLRSAAPTPDTAHPSRMRLFFPDDNDQDDADEDDEEDALDNLASPNAHRSTARTADGDSADKQEESSDFQAWFWENRGDLNRSWMRRRKTAAKERRMKDNKTRGFTRA
ncbi:hypothetical protein BROUX41_002941 [Berkeleyomyces rouxiae]|uniref:uncharacterized protein n=1 Tax=Berkeleyomyces rouxiae TaxID=2035830 RepID=UPI003B80774F